MTPAFLHGMHDPGGEDLMASRPGWIVFTEAIGADPDNHAGRDYRKWSDQGFGVIVRLNNGYGETGTIPQADRYGVFATRVANFIAASPGCTRWIIGNEPNHANGWPGGVVITSEQYAACFRAVWVALRSRGIAGELITAAIAPWNVQAGDWIVYQQAILSQVGDIAHPFPVHPYTHGPDPALVTSEAKMQAPFAERRYHFRTYRDLLAVVPERLRHLPVYITETNQGDLPWLDANSGFVRAAYAEIDRWNQQAGTQKIHCLCLYRWPNYDQWGIEHKPGVQDDFAAAVAQGYRVPRPEGTRIPAALPAEPEHTLHLPSISNGPSASTPEPTPIDWDPRLTERGVEIMETAVLVAHPVFWGVVRGAWLDEQQSGGGDHILVGVLGGKGNR